MASCVICHRLDRGFASPKGQYCSMDCMNAVAPNEAYMPYEVIEEAMKGMIEKPLSEFSMDEAKALSTWIISYWTLECRTHAGIDDKRSYPNLWHHEPQFLETAMLHADPNNLVRSVVDRFIEECRLDMPF